MSPWGTARGRCLRTWYCLAHAQSDLPVARGLASWLEYKCVESVTGGQMDGHALVMRLTTPEGQPLTAHEALVATVRAISYSVHV